MNNIELTVQTPEYKSLSNEAGFMMMIAQTVAITDNKTYNEANELVRRIKEKSKDLNSRRKEITKPLDDAKKKVMELFKPPLEVMNSAEKIIKAKMIGYNEAQDRIRKEEEAKARGEQRRMQEKLHKDALHAAKQGDTEMANFYAEQADHVPVISREVEKPKAAGAVTMEIWSAEVVDIDALAKAVINGEASPEAILPNMKFLNQMAKSLKKNFNVPGAKAVSRKTVAVRT